MQPVIAFVVREQVENAAFFWAQRDTLAAEDPSDTDTIAFIDGRLEANLDALRIAGNAAWPFIITAFETFPEKGELFVMTHHALETGDAKRLEQAVGFARVATDGARGLCGAFEWLPPSVTAPVVRIWIDSGDRIRTEAALAAIIAHGGNPGDRLERLMRDGSDRIREMAAILVARAGVAAARSGAGRL
ncbi:MAG: hypothetical protein U1E41_03015 [Paracoccus sp. (in: a-proteobacteria)]|jgi:hypothetical protein